MEWGDYRMISIRRGLEDFNELNTTIKGVKDINTLAELIYDNPRYNITNDLRDTRGVIDVNYESICATIKQEKNCLTLLPEVECWDNVNYITVNMFFYKRYNFRWGNDGRLEVYSRHPYDLQEYYYSLGNNIYRDGKFIEKIEDDDSIDGIDNIILRLIELNRSLKPLIDLS